VTTNKNHVCDFCQKAKEDVEKLIVGDNAAICNDCVELCISILDEDKVKKFPLGDNKNLLNPVHIKEYLDQYVIGQEKAKIALSVAVCQHFKRVFTDVKDIEIEKTNVLILGPTGCGKTMLAKKLAEYLNVPFAICDATGLTEAGYVGDDVESVLNRLISAADGDIDKAKQGIVYIDEIDKLSRKGENTSLTRDVGGEGVQQGLLKMIEGSVIRVPAADKRKHPRGDMIEVDTKNILFICGGAFVGLEKIINRRSKSGAVGFGASVTSSKDTLGYSDVITKDLITFGLIPEFIGRFGLITHVDELSVDDLVKILKEPKNSLISQYKHLFSIDGIELEFKDEALKEVAEKSKQLQTNARGLKNILEKILLNYQFEAMDLVQRGLTKIVISKEAVNGKSAELIFNKTKKKLNYESNS
jgi:ATP-dependent Clp protease ATP-binding subunit ClpX